MTPTYMLRTATDEDTAYILKTWRKAKFMWSSPKESIQALTKDCYIVHEPEVPEYILGWVSTTEPSTVNYIHVRLEWRKHGIASFILDTIQPTHYTFRTPDGLKFLQNRYDNNKTCPKFKALGASHESNPSVPGQANSIEHRSAGLIPVLI